MKIPHKLKGDTGESETTSRITNDTVAQHRKRAIMGGRRFKYPIQYARNRLVINTITISLIFILCVIVFIWWQLYPMQNTSTFFYKITRVVPVPVASVDGSPVKYSNYLMVFRSQVHYLDHKEGVGLNSKDNKNQLNYIKRTALDNAISNAYAAKLAKKLGITVSDDEITSAIKQQRQLQNGLTPIKIYSAIIHDNFGWTLSEVRQDTANELLKQKVAFRIDDTASKVRDMVVGKLKSTKDLSKIAKSMPAVNGVKVKFDKTPFVPTDNQDGGLAQMASTMKKNEVSQAFRSTTGDGYYIVKLLDKKDKKVEYSYIEIPLTEFQKQLTSLRKNGKINEYISIPNLVSEANK